MKIHATPAVLALPALLAILAPATAADASIVLTNGQSVNLAALLAPTSDRQFIIGDKRFTFESFGSDVFDPANFSVIAFVSQNPNQYGLYNIGFDLVGPFGDGTPGSEELHEMNLQYTVEVLPEYYAMGVRLCDVGLTFNGSSSGTGSFARVDETVFDLDQNRFLGNLSAFHAFGPPLQWRPTDARDFCAAAGQPDGFRAFEVNKDIKFLAAGPNGSAGATFVRQEFGQIHTPGPGAVALLGISGAVGARRRRRIA
jgi:hypothetical protein